MGSYYNKLKRIARHANMRDDKFRRRFLGGLSPENQMEVRCIGLSRPIDEIFSSLEEIEEYKAELFS
ncbi:13817_t:CDS:1, partial [Funneliformis geosporum]